MIRKKNGAINPELISAANRALLHRGPDDQGIFVFQNVGLGNTRLSIVGVADGKQPLFNEDKSIVLVCNGEIYNYPGLRAELSNKGHHFATHADCEVIIHLYEEDPHGFVASLEGMFAFVLLDTRRKIVHIARDRVGMKPLFCYDDGDYFLCSSEIKGLLDTGLVPRELNQQAIYDAFSFGYIPGEDTCFRSVAHIPPATIVSYALDSHQQIRRNYWEPTFLEGSRQGALRIGSRSNQVKTLLEQAVASHTIGEVAMSSYLSGGVDSTIIATLLQKAISNGALKTFSIKFRDNEFDESEVFTQTAKLLGFDSQVLEITGFNKALFQQVIYHLEQPQFTPLDIPFFLLSKFVRDHSMKVAFAGEGADEIFGGYLPYTLNQFRATFSTPALSALKPTLLRKVLHYYFRGSELRDVFWELYCKEPETIIDRFGTFPAWYPYWAIHSEFKKPIFPQGKYSDSLGEGSAIHRLSEPLKTRYRGVDSFSKSLYLDLKSRLPNHILLRGDRNSMAHSIELRMPFLDTQVVESANALPTLLKVFGVREKFILRHAFKRVVPKHVIKRKKFGFNAPNEWLWAKDDLRQELLSKKYLTEVGIFEPSGVNKYLSLLETGALDRNSIRYHFIQNALTAVLTTQMLHRNFIRRELPDRQQTWQGICAEASA